MTATYKHIGDLIDRLEIKIEAELATPEYLRSIERQLDDIMARTAHESGRYEQYVHELKALIYGTQGRDGEALNQLNAAVAKAGSSKKLRSRLLRNYAGKSGLKYTAPDSAAEVFKEPVAKKYRILYWYSFLHIAYDLGVVLWIFIFTHPWKRYTDRYVAEHHLSSSAHYLQLQDKTILVAVPAALICIYIAVVVTKQKKNIMNILKLFLVLDLLHVPYDAAKPNYKLAVDALAIGIALLALWSLSRQEPNILKLLFSKREWSGIRRKES